MADPPSPALETLFRTWAAALPAGPGCIDRLRASRHGDLPRWLAQLAALPVAKPSAARVAEAVAIGAGSDLDAVANERLMTALRGLIPWRKGPFSLFGIDIDAEWRSERKWARIAPHVDLRGQRVLDVGCGNGYYGWRMRAAGADAVVGIDPSLLAVAQHAAVAYYAGGAGLCGNVVLPLRLEDLAPAEPFEAIFSLGVIYHRRDGAAHVRALAQHAHGGSTLVLESIVVPGEPLRPRERYARMRNVYLIPTVALLREWLAAASFRRSEVVSLAATTTCEQRATPWMPFDSLAEALAPGDPARTVEGYPAPQRAVIVARR